jgi:hypothetical protein
MIWWILAGVVCGTLLALAVVSSGDRPTPQMEEAEERRAA